MYDVFFTMYEDVGGTWTWVDQLLGPHDDARIGLDGLAMDGDLLAIPVSAGTTGSVQVEVHQHDPVLGWQLLWVLRKVFSGN